MGKPALVPTREQIVDEFGELDRLLRLWEPQVNPHQARHAELEATILGWYETAPATESVVIVGRAYQLEVSARGFKRPFTEPAKLKAFRLLKKVKDLDVMQFFSVSLADVKTYLGQAFLDQNVPRVQTGARQLNVVPLLKAPAKEGKAA